MQLHAYSPRLRRWLRPSPAVAVASALVVAAASLPTRVQGQEAAGLPLPLSLAHRRLLEAAEAAGYGPLDNSAVIRAYDLKRMRDEG